MTATFHVGDAIQIMNRLPEKSVDLVLTSPPFLALRSYLPADHPDKKLEGGSQATPGAYIDWLIDVVEACDRVLAPHGSLCFELGDTYAGNEPGRDRTDGGMYGKIFPNHKLNTQYRPTKSEVGWPLAKSLSLIPELFRLTLVYGTNPLTGRQTEHWRLRNVIRWVRPNPPVGALGDKFRPATSELMVFCKSAKRYFDLDAVREPHKSGDHHIRFPPTDYGQIKGRIGETREKMVGGINPAGAPPLDWWNIPPGGYAGAHYAVWPPELCIKPIKAMTPERVCRTCGEPRRRIVEDVAKTFADGNGRHTPTPGQPTRQTIRTISENVTLGFSDCGHDNWRPGLVLDPFAGSGTTLAVATGHGRDAIGIDLDERNYELALQRVGPLVLEKGEVAA